MVVSRTPASKQTLSASPNTTKTTIKNNNTKSKTKMKTRSWTRTESDDNSQQKQLTTPPPLPRKRNKSRVVRFANGRIYDSKNGKTCHQCRQKTMDFAASCKNKRDNMPACSIHFCHKCLLNRYGEKAEEVAALENWMCPKCRRICNCSLCMKKRGCRPTGALVHLAKVTGCSSAAELLNLEDSKKVVNDVGASPKKLIAPNEMLREYSTRKRLMESEFDGKIHSNSENRHPTEKNIIEDAGASSKRSTASNKLVVASKRRHKAGNGLELDGKSDPKSQPRPLETNGNERETRSSKLKKTRLADETDNSLEINRNDGASTHKAKAHKRDDAGQLVKMNSGVKASKKNHTGPIKVERNETETANNAAGKRKRDSKKNIVEKQSKGSSNQISLPHGIELTNVANIDMPAEDIGDALQFLEFCEAFGQALHLNKGQPESLLRDLAGGRSSLRREDSSVVRFHIKLLSMIQKDSGKVCPLKTGVRNSWLQHLSKFISESLCPSKELLLDSWNVDANGYEELNSSRRLRLLNFLCDEALGTAELRSWIDEKNSEFVEEGKKKALAEKQTEKNMKKRLQDEVARAILLKKGAPLSISENDNLISKIKAEVAQTLAETLEATSIGMKMEQRSDAVRAEPILSDENGRKFWKLRGYSHENNILLQDVGDWDPVTCKERWFIYDDVEQKAKVENYISSLRSRDKKETECGTNVLEMGKKKKVVASHPV